MDAHKLQVILNKHEAWLNGDEGGERADLRSADLWSADLRGASLRGVNLRSASLRDADLRGANLQDASLQDASLRSADLQDANLLDANLRRANLQGADLLDANLLDADLLDADLLDANLLDANLLDANLQDAYLRRANLQDANLLGADLRGADLLDIDKIRTQISPQSGSFTAFKKLRDNIIAKLEIPETAQRSNAPGGRKCRASEAVVLEFVNSKRYSASSMWDSEFMYNVGETVRPLNGFNADWWRECESGIHYYLSQEEAEAH